MYHISNITNINKSNNMKIVREIRLETNKIR